MLRSYPKVVAQEILLNRTNNEGKKRRLLKEVKIHIKPNKFPSSEAVQSWSWSQTLFTLQTLQASILVHQEIS